MPDRFAPACRLSKLTRELDGEGVVYAARQLVRTLIEHDHEQERDVCWGVSSDPMIRRYRRPSHRLPDTTGGERQ